MNTKTQKTQTNNMHNQIDAIKKNNKGRFMSLQLTRKSGSISCFVAQFRKATDKSLVVRNVAAKKDVVIPYNQIETLVIL